MSINTEITGCNSVMNTYMNKVIGNRLPESFKTNKLPQTNNFNFTQSTFKKGDQVRNKKSGHIAIVSGRRVWNKKYVSVVLNSGKYILWSIMNIELVVSE